LYLLWPSLERSAPAVDTPAGYSFRTYRESDDFDLLQLLERDGESMRAEEWQHYRDLLLPDGLFLVHTTSSRELVATAGAAHNPRPGRYYFPFGGELGYLIVDPNHRRRGLGTAVCSAVIGRFVSAGYKSIRVCVQEHRREAIRLYLRLGFEPFLHSTVVERRWRRICEVLGLPFAPDQWPMGL
jgi:mycothiol synthase